MTAQSVTYALNCLSAETVEFPTSDQVRKQIIGVSKRGLNVLCLVFGLRGCERLLGSG